MNGIVELGGIAHDDPALPIKLWDRFVTAFGNEMRRIFLYFGPCYQWRHRGMPFEFIEQAIRRLARALEVGDETTDAKRNALFVGVDETHPGHAAGNGTGSLYHDAFIPLKIEACFDGFTGQEVHFLHRERNVIGCRTGAQARTRAEQAIDPFGQNDDVSMYLAVTAICTNTDDPVTIVLRELCDGGLAKHDRASFPHL